MVSTTCPSLPMRIKAFGVKLPESAALLRAKGRWRPSTSPPPAPAIRKLRRDGPSLDAHDWAIMSASFCVRLCRELDRFADAHIGPASADIAAHRIVDVAVARIGVARQ